METYIHCVRFEVLTKEDIKITVLTLCTLVHSCSLKIKAADVSETSVLNYHIIGRHIQKDCNFAMPTI
jgi:hypothetical protein